MSRTRTEDQMLDAYNVLKQNHIEASERYQKKIDTQKRHIDRLMKHLTEHCPMPANCEVGAALPKKP